MHSKEVRKLGVFIKGMYKDSFCIVINRGCYFNHDELVWYTVLKDNDIIKVSKNSIRLL
jgi:hypothetical protein